MVCGCYLYCWGWPHGLPPKEGQSQTSVGGGLRVGGGLASPGGRPAAPDAARIRQHTKLAPDCRPLLVFVNPRSGGLKGRDLLCSFRKLLNPHQVFELTNGGPLPG